MRASVKKAIATRIVAVPLQVTLSMIDTAVSPLARGKKYARVSNAPSRMR